MPEVPYEYYIGRHLMLGRPPDSVDIMCMMAVSEGLVPLGAQPNAPPPPPAASPDHPESHGDNDEQQDDFVLPGDGNFEGFDFTSAEPPP